MYYQQMPPPPPPENIGKEIWKVVWLQLSIFLAYQFLLAVICYVTDNESFIILDMFPLILHWLVLLVFMIIGFARGKKGRGLGYLIVLFTTLIVGFGSCWLIADMIGSSFI